MPQTNINPTIISSDVNGIRVRQGAADAVLITSDRVRISSLRFQRFDNPGGKATVSIDLSLTYNTTNPQLAITNTLISAVGRATAATFDSDLLPDATNIRNVGGVNLGWRRVLVGDGSASDPSYSFSAGTAMGLFRAGANILGFSTNSIERMRIDATGNVGIGTTTPGALLNVGSLTNSTRAFGDHPALFVSKPTEHTVPTAEIRFSPGNPLCVGCQNIALKVTTDDNQGSNKQNIGLWVDANRAANNYAAIFNTGNVGIGTTGPNTALDVSGAISVRGMAAPPVSPTGQGRIYFDSSLNRFRVSQHGAAYVDLVGGGGGTPGGTSGAVQFNAAGVFGGDATNLFWDNANMRLGIGTTAPATRLHVVGVGSIGAAGNVERSTTGLQLTAVAGVAGTASTGIFFGGDGIAHANIAWMPNERNFILRTGNFSTQTTDSYGGANLLVSGNVGIGTTGPGSKLHVQTASSGLTSTVAGLNIESNTHQYIQMFSPANTQQGLLVSGGAVSNEGGILWEDGTRGNYLSLIAGSAERLVILGSTGNVGIGTTGPSARLSLTTTGSELGGTAASPVFRTMAGALGTAATNELNLGSIGFTSTNQSSLGIRALRTAAGTGWDTTAIGLGMDVDNTVRAGASIWLHANSNVGIGTTSPGARLDVAGLGVNAVGFRTINSAGTRNIFLVPELGSGGYNPLSQAGDSGIFYSDAGGLTIGPHSGFPRGIRIDSIGNVGIGTTDPGTNRLEVVGGPIRATGGLIIETRTSDPASPVAGQMWLRTDL
ncbi:MAG: hypothetical protein DDT19_02981 [Syntrophomonadaceae bacterium]|nr:hypothetical protein [Bacillota bacterium]